MKHTRVYTLCLLALALCVCALPVLTPSTSGETARDGIYQLGDTVEDFEVTTPGGELVSLSGLLETYDAVVINFWFADCYWCQYEFPFMQQAYAEVQDDIAILAITPYDTDEDILAFQEQFALSFIMAKDVSGIENKFGVTGYPTTVIIQKDGTIGYMEAGALPSADDFRLLFDTYRVKESNYTLTFVDQYGAPVPGAIATICDETSCLPKVADAEGKVAFTAAPYPYEIHVIKVPKGYSFDTTQTATMPTEGGDARFTFIKD